MSKPEGEHESFRPAQPIMPADLRVECERCGGFKKYRLLKGPAAQWNGSGCTECMGSGVRLPRKVES